MKSFIIATGLLAAFAVANPVAKKPAGGAGAAGAAGAAPAAGAGASAVAPAAAPGASESVTQAAQNWMKDTGIVSGFLNQAPTLTGAAFTQQAAVALAAEKDELNHKAILDAAGVTGVTAANNSLVTQGHFQAVIDALQDMVTNGAAVGVTDTNSINTNRCANVLPSIDAYLAAAGTNFKAVRPSACDATQVTSLASANGAAPTGAAGAGTGTGTGAAGATTPAAAAGAGAAGAAGAAAPGAAAPGAAAGGKHGKGGN